MTYSRLPVGADNEIDYVVHPENVPASLPGYKEVIKEALSAWHAASGLSFVELKPGEDGQLPAYRAGRPRIEFCFGEPVAPLVSAETTDAGPDSPKRVVFRASLQWRSLRSLVQQRQEAGMGSTQPALWVDDLCTVALHETGHALGLDHSADPQSVMFPLDSPHKSSSVPFLVSSVAVADAISVGKLYPHRERVVLVKMEEGNGGLVIVGSKFCISNRTSALMPEPDAVASWGRVTPFVVMAASGYCFFPSAPSESEGHGAGYGYLYLYVLPIQWVTPETLFVVGGYTLFDAGSSGPAKWRPQLSGGIETGWGRYLPTTNKDDVMFAHFETWGQLADTGGYGQLYFKIGQLPATRSDPLDSPAIRVSGGYTRIGDSGFNGQYEARQWRNALKATSAVTIGFGRTMSDERQDYPNAFSSIQLWVLQDQQRPA